MFVLVALLNCLVFAAFALPTTKIVNKVCQRAENYLEFGSCLAIVKPLILLVNSFTYQDIYHQTKLSFKDNYLYV